MICPHQCPAEKTCQIFMDACIFDGVQHSVLCEAFDRISLIPPRTPSPPFEDKAKPSRGGPVERGGPALPLGRGGSAYDQWFGSVSRS